MANIITSQQNSSKDDSNKMTIDEYIEKYSHPKNLKEVKGLLFLFISAIGVVMCCMLFSFIQKMFEMNEIAGYISLGISLLILLFLYIVPTIRILTSKQFITNVSSQNAKSAQRHNKHVRQEIADKMIDLNVSTQGCCWYSDSKIGPIAIARSRNDDKLLSKALTDIYNTDVKKASDKLIRDTAFQVGLTTSISQSERVDSLIVTVSEINLIKKLVYLYGYRPNDSQMLKIYKSVLVNALLAYGVESATTSIAGGLGKLIGGAAKEIPIISTVIGSVTDGTINATLTAIVGFQTIKYLKREYKLQDILDGVEIEESEEKEQAIISDIKKDVINSAKKGKA